MAGMGTALTVSTEDVLILVTGRAGWAGERMQSVSEVLTVSELRDGEVSWHEVLLLVDLCDVGVACLLHNHRNPVIVPAARWSGWNEAGVVCEWK
jgi:hypothetical protein